MDNENSIQLTEVSKTLFIPLAVRAREAARAEPAVRDIMAADILRRCNTDEIITDGGGISSHGILARTVVIDTQVRNLLVQNPRSLVINLGAGLDTRFFRVDNGELFWLDLDLPEVITLRRHFMPQNHRLSMIPASVLDSSWVKKARQIQQEGVIIIAEGLLMYFTENEVKEILHILMSAFPEADMIFDIVHSYFVGRKISSSFRWGVEKAEEIERIDPKIKVIQSWSTGDLLKDRQHLLLRIMNILPSTRNRSQILHIDWKGGRKENAKIQ